MSDEVENAIRTRRPAVVIESALLLHHVLHPQNMHIIAECVARCRNEGAIPVFAAMVDGTLWIGAAEWRLEQLAKRAAAVADPSRARPSPVCLRDIAVAIHAGWSGGTTTAATIAIARLAGITVCVTATVRGIDHDGSPPSADMEALARHPVALVTSGIASPCDIASTHRAMAALSLPVVGFRCNTLPRFDEGGGTDGDSGGGDSGDGDSNGGGDSITQMNAKEPAEIARILRTNITLNQQHAILIPHPYPHSKEDEPEDEHHYATPHYAASRALARNCTLAAKISSEYACIIAQR